MCKGSDLIRRLQYSRVSDTLAVTRAAVMQRDLSPTADEEIQGPTPVIGRSTWQRTLATALWSLLLGC
jgi:hypothetical protein